MITDRAGTIEYVNSSFVSTSGFTMQEVIGRKPFLLQSEACETAECIRQAVAEIGLESDNRMQVWITVSIGISTSIPGDTVGEIARPC